jgi:hypothetical protein
MRIIRIVQRPALLLSTLVVFAVGLFGPAFAQSADGLPLPPGEIIFGPVFRGQAFLGATCPPPASQPCPGTSTPSIATGVDANAYLFPKYPEPPFTPNAPAVVTLTTAPTQYVRFFTPGQSSAIGAFIVGSNAVRGLTPAQIQNVLALPATPTMETLVLVPAGTCLLIGPANPLFGKQGGAIQEFLVGRSQGGPGCGPVPQFLSSSSFANAQPIGAFALAYAPRAGGGNAGAVANALDHAIPPPLFSDMDSIYNALDLLNIGAPGPLRQALAQLDGEIYADAPSVAIQVGQMFLQVLRDQAHLAQGFTSTANGGAWRPWVSGFGGGGALFGNGDTHGVGFSGGGIAAGGDFSFFPALRAGVAAAYAQSAFNASGFVGSGGLNTFAVGSYAGYEAGPWYVDGAVGYSYNSASVNRSINFPGVSRAAFANLDANAFLSRAETGYRFQMADGSIASPFVSFQGIVVRQNGFTESGAGAINLNIDGRDAALALSALGTELSYALPLGLAAPLGVSARAGWAHDFADVNRSVTADFQGTPEASFAVNGARWPRNAAAVGVRFSLPAQSVNLFVRYDGTLASNASIHSATAGLTFVF